VGVTTVSVPRRAVRNAFQRVAMVPGWAVLAVAALLSVLGVGGGLHPAARYVPLLASVLVLGLPHGAVDHLTLARARGDAPTPRSLGAVGALYLLLGGAYAVGWFLAPLPAFLGFLALTWVHWGQGDVYPLVACFDRTHLDDAAGRALTVAVRGGLPMLVPLLGSPERYRAVAARVVGLFDAAAADALGWLTRPDLRLALGVAFGCLTVLTLLRGYRRAGPTASLRVDVGETVLLWAYFLVAPPVVAVGLYFTLWHSLRHVGRLAVVDPRSRESLAGGDPRASLRRVARDAAPLTAVSLLLLAGLAVAVPRGAAGVADLVAVYLVLLAVLTAPHVVVVTALDRRQGIW
jgi:Brp/Blh family beta-carotene 15,15'-monooxygenase